MKLQCLYYNDMLKEQVIRLDRLIFQLSDFGFPPWGGWDFGFWIGEIIQCSSTYLSFWSNWRIAPASSASGSIAR